MCTGIHKEPQPQAPHTSNSPVRQKELELLLARLLLRIVLRMQEN